MHVVWHITKLMFSENKNLLKAIYIKIIELSQKPFTMRKSFAIATHFFSDTHKRHKSEQRWENLIWKFNLFRRTRKSNEIKLFSFYREKLLWISF